MDLRRGMNAVGSQLEGEFADVFAWLSTLASMKGISLEAAVAKKYGEGCPRCQSTPCSCA